MQPASSSNKAYRVPSRSHQYLPITSDRDRSRSSDRDRFRGTEQHRSRSPEQSTFDGSGHISLASIPSVTLPPTFIYQLSLLGAEPNRNTSLYLTGLIPSENIEQSIRNILRYVPEFQDVHVDTFNIKLLPPCKNPRVYYRAAFIDLKDVDLVSYALKFINSFEKRRNQTPHYPESIASSSNTHPYNHQDIQESPGVSRQSFIIESEKKVLGFLDTELRGLKDELNKNIDYRFRKRFNFGFTPEYIGYLERKVPELQDEMVRKIQSFNREIKSKIQDNFDKVIDKPYDRSVEDFLSYLCSRAYITKDIEPQIRQFWNSNVDAVHSKLLDMGI